MLVLEYLHHIRLVSGQQPYIRLVTALRTPVFIPLLKNFSPKGGSTYIPCPIPAYWPGHDHYNNVTYDCDCLCKFQTPPTIIAPRLHHDCTHTMSEWLVLVSTWPQILGWAARLQLLSPTFVSMDTTKLGLMLIAVIVTSMCHVVLEWKFKHQFNTWKCLE